MGGAPPNHTNKELYDANRNKGELHDIDDENKTYIICFLKTLVCMDFSRCPRGLGKRSWLCSNEFNWRACR